MAEHTPPVAVLHALSNFSFQIGASHPEELVERAHALGHSALALTDLCSLAGAVRAHVAAQAVGLKLILGTTLTVADPDSPAGGFNLVLLATDRASYGRLCELITHARQHPPSGLAGLEAPGHWPVTAHLGQWPAHLSVDGLLAVVLPWRHRWALQPPEGLEQGWTAQVRFVQALCPERTWLGAEWANRFDDRDWQCRLRRVAERCGVPVAACPPILMHRASRKPLHDVLTAVRLHTTLDDLGQRQAPHAQACLAPLDRWIDRYPPDWLAETGRIAARCDFSLSSLRYEYPTEPVPAGISATMHLRQLTLQGAQKRYPTGIPAPVQAQIEHELALIEELAYEPYFLTVHDIVAFARSRGILCQGRGSAANSAVCYCLGITEVDPARSAVLFERFISRERQEPPDIDVDFEHERREEVIQYLYRRYGRDRAALTATVIRYRPRSACRDVGRAMGVHPDVLDQMARQHRWWDGADDLPQRWAEAGLDVNQPLHRQLVRLCRTLLGFPRHLSQHTGGFVLTGDRLVRTVPVVPAAMAGRTTIEWDKDDIDALGILKVDVLALGMLSALRRALDLMSLRHGRPWTLADIPAEDPATYDMVCRADTVGVFQIESRAQMSMLPRLQPRCFYDLVVEVALVRPGPIQGGMVHPYLKARERHRQGLPLELPNEVLRPALARTLGVPIFQEQVMQIAILAAGFSPGEADALRRSMAAWRRTGHIQIFHDRLVQGMVARGYSEEFAEAIFRQVEGFGEYGFPESHAASFALLVYASAWIKRHEPACFLAALLNAQPMGFYGPSQLVQDARRHGVEVRPIDVCWSGIDCTLEGDAVRLGLRLVAGLSHAAAERIVAARGSLPGERWASVQALAKAARLHRGDLAALAAADALQSISGHRRQQAWDGAGCEALPPVLAPGAIEEAPTVLEPAPLDEAVWHDYAATGLSLRAHPMALLRPNWPTSRLHTAAALAEAPAGRLVMAAGLVTARQRPGTAKGVMFLTLEDETGTVQVVVWRTVQERHGAALIAGRLLEVRGPWQREGSVGHLIAGHVIDRSAWLGDLRTPVRHFR